MRRSLAIALPILATVLSLPAQATPPAAPAVYGKGVSLAAVATVSEVLAAPGRFYGREVAVTGLVVDVCSTRGCWLELAGERPYETIRVQVEEGVVVIPLDARGRAATVQGRVEVADAAAAGPSPCDSCPSAKSLAERSGAPSAVKAPGVRILATGAVIR